MPRIKLAKLEKTPKMNMTKPNYRDLHRYWKKCYPWMIRFDSFLPAPIHMFMFNKMDTWQHLSIAEQKLKWGKTKKINSFLHSHKKSSFFLEGGGIAPNAQPQLRQWHNNMELMKLFSFIRGRVYFQKDCRHTCETLLKVTPSRMFSLDFFEISIGTSFQNFSGNWLLRI